MKAREWLERGRRSADPIDALASFWRAFSSLFNDVNNGQERDKIKLILSQQLTEEQAEAILQINADSVTYLLAFPIIDMRGNGKDTILNIQAFRIADDSLVKITELFMIIYQVRCNLEHGQKSPKNERDIQLCQASAPLVADVVDQIS